MKKFQLQFSRLAIAAVLLTPLSAATAGQVILEATRDNTIFADSTGSSNGLGDNFAAGKGGGASAVRRGLVAFDLSGLPTPIRVDRAALVLTFQGSTNQESDDRVISIHRLLSSWGEGTSNAGPGGMAGTGNGSAAAPNDATWRHRFFSTQTWASHDPTIATSGGGDFASQPSAAATIGIVPGVLATWETIRNGSPEGMVADVELWLANPAANNGWLLKMADETPLRTARRFYSKDDANSAFHPRLIIDYTVVPEPATLALVSFAVAGMAMALRLSEAAH